MRTLLLLATHLLVITSLAAAAEVGDLIRITLDSGKVVTGTVVEETPHKFVIKTALSGISFEKTFAKSGISAVETIETDLSKELKAVRGNAPAPVRTLNEGGYAVVPARGSIGEELTAGFFEEVLERAEREEAELVIFHLDSPGGYISVLEQIRQVLDQYDRDMEIAFYVDSECFSAAALLSMSAEHMYVGPGARFGAAVGFSWNNSGSAQVDAKFNSAMAATWRSYAEKHGRPGILIDAMVLPEVEVYADTSTSPWTLTDEKPSIDAGDDEESTIKRIDSRKTILSVTYEEATDLGAVNGTANDPKDLLREIEIEHPDREAFDGEALWKAHEKRYRTNTKTVDKAIEDYAAAADLAQLQTTRYGLKSKVRGMTSNLRKASTLAKRYDYVRIRLAARDITVEDLDSTIAYLNQIIAEL